VRHLEFVFLISMGNFCTAQSASAEEVEEQAVVQEPTDPKPTPVATEGDNAEPEKGSVEASPAVSEPPLEGAEKTNNETPGSEKADADKVVTDKVDAEKAAVKPSIELTFKESDKKAAATKTFVFYVMQPGIDLSKKMPMKVTAACKKQTPAEAAGVKKGMVLTTVAGQDVTGLKYKEASELFQKFMNELPEKEAVVLADPLPKEPTKAETEKADVVTVDAQKPETVVEEVKPSIELVFKVSDKKDAEVKSCVFYVNSTGIDFSKKMPMKVTGCKKKTAGEAAGVKKGMVLTTVAGQDITSLQYSEANALLEKGVKELPSP